MDLASAGPGGVLYDWQVAIAAFAAVATAVAVILSLWLARRAVVTEEQAETKASKRAARQVIVRFVRWTEPQQIPGSIRSSPGPRSFVEVVNGSSEAITDVTVAVTFAQSEAYPDLLTWQWWDVLDQGRISYILGGAAVRRGGAAHTLDQISRQGEITRGVPTDLRSMNHHDIHCLVAWRDSMGLRWRRWDNSEPHQVEPRIIRVPYRTNGPARRGVRRRRRDR